MLRSVYLYLLVAHLASSQEKPMDGCSSMHSPHPDLVEVWKLYWKLLQEISLQVGMTP